MTHRPSVSRWGFLSIFYAGILLLILILAYSDNLPAFLGEIPHHDTIGHFVLYGIATYLGHRVLRHRKIKLFRQVFPLWPLLFGIFAVTEEILQMTSPNRNFSWLDMVASVLGIYFGYWLVEKTQKPE
ncbi:VanZ family protein [Lusitaniella coriacea LEGE 07157]|uniref:VanZ family protein n=1 Tax=Lusitaniella coriacea LEGE 07157 TaxID=945747 RepID=A0A8J7DLN8_9CYAN|nr:VanZ family protein [Lusitaniella coriacea]MBE9115433.1 VanZ family protein [Lusitaniella coriacea LEGE 07157]